MAQAIAPQSLMDADRTLRIVVAMTAKFGYAAAVIIATNLATPRVDRFSSTPSTANPRDAVKSSSLPIFTSMNGAIAWLTCWALAIPPIACHRLGR